MDTKPIFDYLNALDFTQYSMQEYDEYNTMDTATEELNNLRLIELKSRFEECLFQAMAESPSFKEQIPIIENKLTEIIDRFEEYKDDELLCRTLSKGDDSLIQSAKESLNYIKKNYLMTNNIDTEPITDKIQEESFASSKTIPIKYKRTLDNYGDFLSVKDLTTIFHCTPRTITNWETKGYLFNVAETNSDTTRAGRKKRGAEKRFRKDAILTQIELQEKFKQLN